MIDKKLVAMMALAFLGTTSSAWAGNLRCMNLVIGHVLEDFDRLRMSTGIVAQDTNYDHHEVNLGYVNEKSVTVSDIGKDSFQVEIPFDSTSHGPSKGLLKITIYEVDYNNCAFNHLEKIAYRLHVRQ